MTLCIVDDLALDITVTKVVTNDMALTPQLINISQTAPYVNAM